MYASLLGLKYRYRKTIGAVQHVETCQAVQSILIDDDEDDDLIGLDLPHLESEEVVSIYCNFTIKWRVQGKNLISANFLILRFYTVIVGLTGPYKMYKFFRAISC